MMEARQESLYKKVAKFEKMRRKSLAKQLKYLSEKVSWIDREFNVYKNVRMSWDKKKDGTFVVYLHLTDDDFSLERKHEMFRAKTLEEIAFIWWIYFLK